jgi:hypothetical protein
MLVKAAVVKICSIESFSFICVAKLPFFGVSTKFKDD